MVDIISVFIQNVPGRLSHILREVGTQNIHGFSIADAGEFGIVRLCIDEPEKAVQMLKKHDIIACITPSVAIDGKYLQKTSELFDKNNINIDDAIYAVVVNGTPLAVLKVSDTNKTQRLLEENGIPFS